MNNLDMDIPTCIQREAVGRELRRVPNELGLVDRGSPSDRGPPSRWVADLVVDRATPDAALEQR